MQRIEQKRMSLGAWARMGLLALFWGGSFAANRFALTEETVAWTLALRAFGAAITLWLYVRFAGLAVPRGLRFWVTSAALGVFNNVIPWGLILWGQTHVASGLAGILNASTALFAVLLASTIFPDEKLTPTRLIGVGLGLAGVAAVIGPSALSGLDLRSLAQLAFLGAASSYAVAGSIARLRFAGVRPEVGAAGMLTATSVLALPFAWLTDGPPAMPGPVGAAGIAYLVLLASAFGYRLYYTILAEAGAGNTGLVTLLLSPVAVLLGWAFFGETLPPSAFVGLGLISAGMILLDGSLARRLIARFFA